MSECDRWSEVYVYIISWLYNLIEKLPVKLVVSTCKHCTKKNSEAQLFATCEFTKNFKWNNFWRKKCFLTQFLLVYIPGINHVASRYSQMVNFLFHAFDVVFSRDLSWRFFTPHRNNELTRPIKSWPAD